MIPSTFSIDFLASKKNGHGSRHDSIGEDSLRQTPSPSPSDCSSGNGGDRTESIAQVLLSLDKTIKGNVEESSEEKPPQSYIAMISMAILSSPEKRMLLCDIYQYIMENFRYYNNKSKAWRNSIRHNLSLNECFIKNGRSENGKGNYWSIHPACAEDFSRGDFRRRQARRRARKSMKEVDSFASSIDMRGNNGGCVPMTSSAVGYHPYTQPSVYIPPYSYPPSSLSNTPTLPSTTSAAFFHPVSSDFNAQSHATFPQNIPGW